MPIRFRCEHCGQLMSIATRKAGAEVPCATCGELTSVPAPEEPVVEATTPPVEHVSVPPASHGDASPAAFPIEERLDAGIEPESDEGEASLRFRRETRPQEEMDLTPMVDMTFLLLIFFMVTASFSQQKTLQVPPPDSDKKGAVQSIEEIQDVLDSSIRISIDERNAISVDDDIVNDRSQLPAILREKMRIDLKSEAMVQIDPRALHETVVSVVDACNEVGVQKIRLATRSGSP